jgi:nucleotide-binding universal stress UspA family protein
VVERLHQQVTDLDPSAEFQFERVDGSATPGTISTRLRQKADEIDADMIFVGSENAGRIITPLTSVAGGVTADRDYDVCIVRHRLPPAEKTRLKSEFFIPT